MVAAGGRLGACAALCGLMMALALQGATCEGSRRPALLGGLTSFVLPGMRDRDEVKPEVRHVTPRAPSEDALESTGELSNLELREQLKKFETWERNASREGGLNREAQAGDFLDLPPKPLQVFEWGATSREQWRKNREKYQYQYVCIMDRENGGVWYQRKAPKFWSNDNPPFHVRIIRPNWAGMALEAMDKGKARIRLVKKEVQTAGGERKIANVYEIVPK